MRNQQIFLLTMLAMLYCEVVHAETKELFHLCYIRAEKDDIVGLTELVNRITVYNNGNEEEFTHLKSAVDKCLKLKLHRCSPVDFRIPNVIDSAIDQLVLCSDSIVLLWVADSSFSRKILNNIRSAIKEDTIHKWIIDFITIPDIIIGPMNMVNQQWPNRYDVDIIKASVYGLKQSVLTAAEKLSISGQTYKTGETSFYVTKDDEDKSTILDSLSKRACGEIDPEFKDKIDELNPSMPEVPGEGYKVRLPQEDITW